MRAWGIGFLVAAAGATILGRVNVGLAYLLVAVVAIAFVVSLVGGYADRRVQRELDQAEKTRADVEFFRNLAKSSAHDEAETEAEWKALVAATHPRPLGPTPPPIVSGRLRTVTPKVPAQRRAGEFS